MEVLEDRSDMIAGSGMSEQTGSRVLDVLEFIREFGWCSVKTAVTVVNSGCDKGMEFQQQRGRGMGGGELCQVVLVT